MIFMKIMTEIMKFCDFTDYPIFRLFVLFVFCFYVFLLNLALDPSTANINYHQSSR